MIIKNRKTGVLSEVTEEQWDEMQKSKRSLLFKVEKDLLEKSKSKEPKVLQEFISSKKLKIEEIKKEE